MEQDRDCQSKNLHFLMDCKEVRQERKHARSDSISKQRQVVFSEAVEEFAKEVALAEKEEAGHEIKDVFLAEFAHFWVLIAQKQNVFGIKA